MKQIIIRKIFDDCIEKANALKKGLAPTSNGLSKYAGDSNFGPEWDVFTQNDLNKIDTEIWIDALATDDVRFDHLPQVARVAE